MSLPLLTLTGCSMPWSRKTSWDQAEYDPFSNPDAAAELSPEKDRGILQTAFNTPKLLPGFGGQEKSSTQVSSGQPSSPTNARSTEEMNQAEQLVKAGQYAQAEEILNDIVKKYRLDDYGKRATNFKNIFRPSTREPHYTDSPMREEALYLLGESQYHLRKYPKSQDSFLRLVNDYPSTRYLEESTRRLFEISGLWMDLQVTTTGDVLPASYTPDGKASSPVVKNGSELNAPSFFNFSDPERPKLDTEGRALESLKAIWLHDPTGPLADDALMLTASYQLRKGQYEAAAETYKLLRDEYPDSPHTKDAFLLGSHVAQASYLGSSYEEKNLQESKRLKETSLKLFGDLTEEQRARVQTELARIDDAIIRREYDRAVFYLRKGDYDAVAIYCNSIINQYPKSPYAQQARDLLRSLDGYRGRSPLIMALQGAGEAPSNTTQQPSSSPSQTPELQPTPPQPKRSFSLPNLVPTPLRRKEAEPAFPEPTPAETEVDLNAPSYDTPPGEASIF